MPVFDPLAVSTDLGGKVDEREHHREEGAVAVNVEVLALVPLAAEDAEHAVEVVDGALDRRADVNVDDRRAPAVGREPPAELVIVDFAHRERGHRLAVHFVVPRGFEDGKKTSSTKFELKKC